MSFSFEFVITFIGHWGICIWNWTPTKWLISFTPILTRSCQSQSKTSYSPTMMFSSFLTMLLISSSTGTQIRGYLFKEDPNKDMSEIYQCGEKNVKCMKALKLHPAYLRIKPSLLKNLEVDLTRGIARPENTSKLLFQIVIKWVAHSVTTPALLCHKEPAQGTQSPLLGALGRNAPY